MQACMTCNTYYCEWTRMHRGMVNFCLTDRNVTFACQSSQQGIKLARGSEAQSAFILAL